MTTAYYQPLPEIARECSTLIELLQTRAEHEPDRRAYTYLLDGEAAEVSLTYRELDRQARAIGALLQSYGMKGERALLLYPPGIEFITAFFGCLYAGAIAVPAYPPDPSRLGRTLPRLQSLILDARAKVALTTSQIVTAAEPLLAQLPKSHTLKWVASDKVDEGLNSSWVKPSVCGDDLAFFQYTSGSTGSPKGVMLSNTNLLHNASLVYRAVEHSPRDKYISWLPTFHDMGFMAGVLEPLFAGIPVVLMSPIQFLQNPVRWLKAISRHRATTSGGPNFAYDLCARKITPQDCASLDLSSWSVAFNGAEPVRAETMERFTRVFEPCGFNREAFYPCYGLAEATLMVSGSRKSAPPVIRMVDPASLEQNRVVKDEFSGARSLVGCGRNLFDQKIVIANPETLTECQAGEVGEVWVSGPSVAQGYWNRPELTEETFNAYLSDKAEGPFLRTGDLGFFQGDELFITGRHKDLIIIRGRNHYPQDIEQTVEGSHMALRRE
jgi:acyl-CoA synthetase (AMP-forming)/AMP-acid ligase II